MSQIKFISIGNGNLISLARVISVVKGEASPIKRLIQEARDKSCLIDATAGKKTKAVILMDSDHVILSSMTVEDVYAQIQKEDDHV